jgi:hypothetical protein
MLLDWISAHFAAVCDSLVAVTLLSIASCWTLPTDVTPMRSQSNLSQVGYSTLEDPAPGLRHLTSHEA